MEHLKMLLQALLDWVMAYLQNDEPQTVKIPHPYHKI